MQIFLQQVPLRWLYVDFNSYFASVEQQLEPRLRGKPVAVVPVQADSTCAIAASYEAKAFGIRTGTPIHEAKRLCPALICVLARHDRYVEFHHRILTEIGQHIPVTAVCSIDEMACRLMDNETALPTVRRIATNIKRGLSAHVGAHVRCSIGVAPNRYLAKVATDLQKPDGLTILRLEDLPHALYRLDLRDLPGIGRSMDRRLTQAGITDMPALWALSARQMRAVWGNVWGERMWQLLRGEDLPEIETERRSIGHSHVLAPELREPGQAKQVARRLLLKACSRLRRMDYYASALCFSARLENGMRVGEDKRCWRAQDSMAFLKILDGMWSQYFAGMTQMRVKKVAVTLHGLLPAADVPPDLLDIAPGPGHARQRAERLSRAMDRLNHRFGRDTIGMGLTPVQSRNFSGPKIAFTRIPDREEFVE